MGYSRKNPHHPPDRWVSGNSHRKGGQRLWKSKQEEEMGEEKPKRIFFKGHFLKRFDLLQLSSIQSLKNLEIFQFIYIFLPDILQVRSTGFFHKNTQKTCDKRTDLKRAITHYKNVTPDTICIVVPRSQLAAECKSWQILPKFHGSCTVYALLICKWYIMHIKILVVENKKNRFSFTGYFF